MASQTQVAGVRPSTMQVGGQHGVSLTVCHLQALLEKKHLIYSNPVHLHMNKYIKNGV